MTKASDNLFPGIIIRESADDGSDFSNPAADYRRLFLGEDGLLHVKDSSGTVTSPYTTGGGGVDSGTSNPGSPSDGDLFYRTDLDLLIRYRSSGTRWVTATLYHTQMAIQEASVLPLSANGQFMYAAMWGVDFDVWVEKWYANTTVLTTNNGSNFWTCVLEGKDGTDLATFNTSADSANTGTNHEQTVGALLGTTFANDAWVQVASTKTSAPGNLYIISAMSYRLVVT